MPNSFEALQSKIPASKFFPPQFDPNRYLLRQRLLQFRLQADSYRKKLLYIEGQAGQGKSTLAIQYLNRIDVPFVWYQVEPEDADPVFLTTALLTALREKLPEFSASLLEQMLAGGEGAANEASKLARLLAEDLQGYLRSDLYLVFDDLHLLQAAPLSLAFISALLEAAPSRLKFIFTSRERLPAECDRFASGAEATVLANHDLALDQTEISGLFNEIFGIPLSATEVNQLYRQTEGWMAGLILAGHGLKGASFHYTRIEPQSSSSLIREGGIVDFFKTEVFSRVPEELKNSLYKLSLLENIPVDLAEKLSEVPDIGDVLEKLRRSNFFIRSLDEENRTYVFHSLFREFLKERARQALTAKDVSAAYEAAGNFFLQQGDPLKGIGYFLQAEDFATAAGILRNTGMALLATNQIITLKGFLTRIPEALIQQHAWLLFFAGVIRFDLDPPSAFGCFEEALEKFVVDGDELGEILAIAQLVHYHVAVDGQFNMGARLLPRGEELYAQRATELTVPVRVHLAQALAGGFAFFENNTEKTLHYADIALGLASTHKLDNPMATIRTILCFHNTFTGNWAQRKKEIETSQALLKNPRVNILNKSYLAMVHTTFLALDGDFANYRRHKELLVSSNEGGLISRSIGALFFLIYDINHALFLGQFDKALALVRKGLDAEGAGAGPHVLSQLYHFQALLLALKGQPEQAMDSAQESRRLRIVVGGPRFIGKNEVVLGATCNLLQKYQEAEPWLDSAVGCFKKIGEHYLLCAAYAHRAYLRLKTGRHKEAGEDVTRLLEGMRQNSYSYFLSWVPQVMQDVLSFAVKEGIDAAFAQKLARKRLHCSILPTGERIPLLNITALGTLALRSGDDKVVEAADLTPAWRQFLAILLASPGYRITQEALQLRLWPDSPPAKSRTKFDTLISRLRKFLDQRFGAGLAKNYLVVQKGLVGLENCRVDAEEFQAHARQGRRLAHDHHSWQADNAFFSAMRCWKGGYLADHAEADDLTVARMAELDRDYLEAAGCWGQLLVEGGKVKEGIEVISSALLQDPVNHELVKTLYNLHAAAGSPRRAAKVLHQYRKALQADDYSPEEIEDIIDSLWDSSAD